MRDLKDFVLLQGSLSALFTEGMLRFRQSDERDVGQDNKIKLMI